MSTATVDVTERSARPPLATLWRVEARKMVDTRAGKWLLGLTVVLAAGGSVAGLLGGDGNMVDSYLTATALASILLPVVGVLLVTSEWSQRTALLTFVMVPNRNRVALAKALAAISVAAALALLCLAFALVATPIAGKDLEISAGDIGQGALYEITVTTIGVALGLALRISPLAIVAYFAAPTFFALFGAISASAGDVTRWLDQSGLTALAEANPSGDEWARAAVTVGVWILIPLAFGLSRLAREDVS